MERKPSGYTLIELLVVIVIIAILIGLLLSAVQKVREAANRATCLNHLKQNALGLHHFHDAKGQLPVGYYPAAGNSPFKVSGWPLQLLPYVEQTAIHEEAKIDFLNAPILTSPLQHRHFPTVIKVYTCPSDSRVQSAQMSPTGNMLVAFTSYLGSCGTSCDREDGVLFPDSVMKFQRITDGLSQTILLGERPPSSELRFGWWYAGIGQDGYGSLEMIIGTRERNKLSLSDCTSSIYEFVPSRFSDPCGRFHYWSPHTGGAHFAMCDGSVQFVKYTANEIMPALSTRSGNESIPSIE